MKETEITCLQCRGFKRIFGFHENQDYGECPMCMGNGVIENSKTPWHIYGWKLKQEREKQGLSLRKAALLIGMCPSNLSKMEKGVIHPRFYSYENLS